MVNRQHLELLQRTQFQQSCSQPPGTPAPEDPMFSSDPRTPGTCTGCIRACRQRLRLTRWNSNLFILQYELLWQILPRTRTLLPSYQWMMSSTCCHGFRDTRQDDTSSSPLTAGLTMIHLGWWNKGSGHTHQEEWFSGSDPKWLLTFL